MINSSGEYSFKRSTASPKSPVARTEYPARSSVSRRTDRTRGSDTTSRMVVFIKGLYSTRFLSTGEINDAIAALTFRHIKSIIGDTDQGVDGLIHSRPPGGSAETAGYQMLAIVDGHGFVGQRGPHTLGLIGGASGIASRQDDEKLLAPVAADCIVRAGRGLHAPRKLPQN